MLHRIIGKITSVLLLAGLALLPILVSRPALAVTCSVTPDTIPISLNYHGATLTVSGENQAGDDLIIRITSPAADAHYKFMGKAGGLFWMKKGDVSFSNVPGVYLLFTSREMDKLLSVNEQEKNLIGYEALKSVSKMETASAEVESEAARWKEEFFRFKEHQNLYAIRTGTITRNHGQNSDNYQLEASWPFQAPPGTYTVETLAIRNGLVVEKGSAQFTVARAGIVAQLSDLAFNNAALYGIMAVVIAIIAGFAVGMIFKKGGGAH